MLCDKRTFSISTFLYKGLIFTLTPFLLSLFKFLLMLSMSHSTINFFMTLGDWSPLSWSLLLTLVNLTSISFISFLVPSLFDFPIFNVINIVYIFAITITITIIIFIPNFPVIFIIVIIC